jgi:hypothetical protein
VLILSSLFRSSALLGPTPGRYVIFVSRRSCIPAMLPILSMIDEIKYFWRAYLIRLTMGFVQAFRGTTVFRRFFRKSRYCRNLVKIKALQRFCVNPDLAGMIFKSDYVIRKGSKIPEVYSLFKAQEGFWNTQSLCF